MPPDPVGSRTGLATLGELGPGPARDVDDAPDWYDRSSLAGDFMVMIAGQTEEDWLRRAPDTFCEFIDGIVYMPPRVLPEHQEDVNFLPVSYSVFSYASTGRLHRDRPGGA